LPISFLALRFMGPLDSCGARDGAPAAHPFRGAWAEPQDYRHILNTIIH